MSEGQVRDVMRLHPQLETKYDLVEEVQPRINYLRFLDDNDRLDGESVASAIARQPQSLERDFSLVHEDDDYSVVNKPWCVRLDTPRGWPGKTRFTPKYPGDLSVEDWLEARYPDWDTDSVRASAGQRHVGGAGSRVQQTSRGGRRQAVQGTKGAEDLLGDRLRSPGGGRVDGGRGDGTRPGGSRKVSRNGIDEDNGKACETRFRVLKRGVLTLKGKFEGVPVSKVEVTPVTGRRHQIRVHLMWSGHPIVGDNAYSEDRDSFRTFPPRAQADDALRRAGGYDAVRGAGAGRLSRRRWNRRHSA
jgi:hypothetical protein